jgi:hypothetical protein
MLTFKCTSNSLRSCGSFIDEREFGGESVLTKG